MLFLLPLPHSHCQQLSSLMLQSATASEEGALPRVLLFYKSPPTCRHWDWGPCPELRAVTDPAAGHLESWLQPASPQWPEDNQHLTTMKMGRSGVLRLPVASPTGLLCHPHQQTEGMHQNVISGKQYGNFSFSSFYFSISKCPKMSKQSFYNQK